MTEYHIWRVGGKRNGSWADTVEASSPAEALRLSVESVRDIYTDGELLAVANESGGNNGFKLFQLNLRKSEGHPDYVETLTV